MTCSNEPKPIVIPARAGGIIPLRIVDTEPIISLWIELCQNVAGKRYPPIQGVLVNAQNGQWTVQIPSTFSADRYGQDWVAVVCIQTQATPADELSALPVTFGLDSDYDAQEYTLTRQITGEVTIEVERITLTEFADTDFLFLYNAAKQI